MSEQRKIIRRAAADALMGKTAAGQNVFPSRSSALGKRKLPAICIYTARDIPTLPPFQESPRLYRRELELRIEAGVEGSNEDDADDALDDLCGQIERLIGRSDRLTYAKEPSVAELYLAGVTTEFQEGGSTIKAGALITYTAIYFSSEPDELDSDPVDDLKRVGSEYSLGATQGPSERARDVVEVAA